MPIGSACRSLARVGPNLPIGLAVARTHQSQLGGEHRYRETYNRLGGNGGSLPTRFFNSSDVGATQRHYLVRLSQTRNERMARMITTKPTK